MLLNYRNHRNRNYENMLEWCKNYIMVIAFLIKSDKNLTLKSVKLCAIDTKV